MFVLNHVQLFATPLPVACQAPLSFIHRISQARILEWVAISFSRGIFPTQGSNSRLLRWQVDSLPLKHLGSLCLSEAQCQRQALSGYAP